MALRVVQWGLGNVGRHAVRGVLEHPDLELAGAFIYTPSKAGRDIGELCGIEPLGMVASDDMKAVLAMPADCVVYAPLLPNIDEICSILASGKNLVTPTGWFFPPTLDSTDVARVEGACRTGNATLHGTGINPGGMSDRFAIMVSALCRNIRSVLIEEFSDIRNYDAPDVVTEVMLMGKPPEVVRASPMLDILGVGFRQSIDMVAYALGVELDDYATELELAVATAPIPCRFGRLEPGTVAGQRFSWSGMAGGRAVITTRVNWLMGYDHLDPPWPRAREVGTGDEDKEGHEGTEGWLISLDADPPVRCRLTTAWDSKAASPAAALDLHEQAYRRDHGIIATAMHVVNSIPYVCAAPAGIVTYLDLPMTAGRLVAT